MTAKDFALIARTVSLATITIEARVEIARDLADALAQTNPLFDRERFLIACDVPVDDATPETCCDRCAETFTDDDERAEIVTPRGHRVLIHASCMSDGDEIA